MLAALFLLVSWLAGFAVLTRAVPSAPAIVRVPGGFLLAVTFTSWTTYLIANVFSEQTHESLRLGLIVSTVLAALVFLRYGRSLRPRHLRMPRIDVFVSVLAVIVSWWLMHQRLRVSKGDLSVSANTWGDFGLHIALSRSFSAGTNYPTQYPFFAGEPIRYHFGFDFFAGMLQKGGMSVQWAFNLPGVIGFSAMMLTTFAIARLLFGSTSVEADPEAPAPKRRWWRGDRGIGVGIVAIVLLLTNQSLEWQRYVTKVGHGNVWKSLDPSKLWHHKDYLSIGPYSNDRIAIFNTLNPYLTQTHLIVAIGLILLITYVLLWQLREGDALDRRLLTGAGVAFGVSFWLNGVVWLAAAVFFGTTLAVWGLAGTRRAYQQAEVGQRLSAARAQLATWLRIGARFVIPAIVLGAPQAYFLSGGNSKDSISIHIGYLVCGTPAAACKHGTQMTLTSLHDWWAFVQFWWLNEGVFIPLLILAFLIGTRRDKKIIAAIAAVFVWGSLLTVGADVGGQNHKTFNLWEVLNGPFAAFALVQIWIVGGRFFRARRRGRIAGRLAVRTAAVVLMFFLVISGVIDAMTVKNDFLVSVFGDANQKQAEQWIIHETAGDATFLTDYDQLYTAATMAGRRVLLGYSSWASSAGYDVMPREQQIAAIYQAADPTTACSLLKSANVDYVIVGPQEKSSTRFKLNVSTFNQLRPATTIGAAGQDQYLIYRTSTACPAT